MTTETQPLIDAIVENIDDSDSRRAQRFLDDLRQEGVLPGRRSRLAFHLRRARDAAASWLHPMLELGQFMFARRHPASYWLRRMDQLLAEGHTRERAAQTVSREMESEDGEHRMRWVFGLMLAGVLAVWILLILEFTGVR